MPILKIARMGHPVLKRVADLVPDPTAPEIRALVDAMIDSMAEAQGIGLAAPQVHVSNRVVILTVPEVRTDPDDPEDTAMPLTALINPEIEPLGGEKTEDWEACLSLPGMTGLVPRYKRIRYSWSTLSGERMERIASGFHARAVQHECDHLDGVLYPMRMTDLSTLAFVDEARRFSMEAQEPRRAAE